MAEWTRVCAVEEIPVLGARVVRTGQEDISVFRNDADEVFALHDRCPHRGGPLSQGIVHGRSVTCPLHNWKIDLASGEAIAPDVGCARTFLVKVVDGVVLVAI
jgi:nitrite reductase (NADH) small subunit